MMLIDKDFYKLTLVVMNAIHAILLIVQVVLTLVLENKELINVVII